MLKVLTGAKAAVSEVRHPLSYGERCQIPLQAEKKAGVAQLARASAFQAEGRGFESRFPLDLTRS